MPSLTTVGFDIWWKKKSWLCSLLELKGTPVCWKSECSSFIQSYNAPMHQKYLEYCLVNGGFLNCVLDFPATGGYSDLPKIFWWQSGEENQEFPSPSQVIHLLNATCSFFSKCLRNLIITVDVLSYFTFLPPCLKQLIRITVYCICTCHCQPLNFAWVKTSCVMCLLFSAKSRNLCFLLGRGRCLQTISIYYILFY